MEEAHQSFEKKCLRLENVQDAVPLNSPNKVEMAKLDEGQKWKYVVEEDVGHLVQYHPRFSEELSVRAKTTPSALKKKPFTFIKYLCKLWCKSNSVYTNVLRLNFPTHKKSKLTF
eukprot:snap_masked-scaffold_15-processed-gene-8.24-mRNA-1 protein AED:1.00 eAED:1.00 QI:0/-1/0/0/-1/1/1/0/114